MWSMTNNQPTDDATVMMYRFRLLIAYSESEDYYRLSILEEIVID